MYAISSICQPFHKLIQVESSHRAIKRMKLDLQEIRANDESASHDEPWRSSSPDKSLARTPQRNAPPIVRLWIYCYPQLYRCN